jgi:hypothetical protein
VTEDEVWHLTLADAGFRELLWSDPDRALADLTVDPETKAIIIREIGIGNANIKRSEAALGRVMPTLAALRRGLPLDLAERLPSELAALAEAAITLTVDADRAWAAEMTPLLQLIADDVQRRQAAGSWPSDAPTTARLLEQLDAARARISAS